MSSVRGSVWSSARPRNGRPVIRRASPAPAASAAEVLERRALLSGVTVGVTPGSSAAGLTYGTLVDDEGGTVIVRDYGTALTIGRPAGAAATTAAAAAPAATGPFDLVLHYGPGLRDHPAAAAAFEQAAAFFESIFHDPVTVVIDVDVAPLGTNQLAQASSVVFGDTFDTVRDALAADADADDEAFVSQLPGESGFFGTLPDSTYTVSGMMATRANLLAMGVEPAMLPGPVSEYAGTPDPVYRDAKITFSSDYPFDYDRSDGIADGLSDFVGVAIHEIGHSLGFVSAVDRVDGWIGTAGDHAVAPMPLDLFRFRPGVGGADFAAATRVLSPGSVVADQVLFDGGVFDASGITSIGGIARGDVPFSTGAFNGDGYQASHWKDESLIGPETTIGAMDPVATEGTRLEWTAADQRAFGLIGWDVAPPVAPATVSGTVYDDANGNGRFDPAAGESVVVGATVYHDANGNGRFDPGVADRFAPAVNLPRAIPDGGVRTSQLVVDDLPGAVNDVNVSVTIEHPYTFDLEVKLVSPAGTEVRLFDNVGEDLFGTSMDFTGTVLDDEAGQGIGQGSPPYTGVFRPQQPLSLLDGEAMNGTWTLHVRDWSGNFHEGRLVDWGLTFDTGGDELGTTTGDDGGYTLELPPGSYRLRQVVPDGYRQTQPAAGGGHDVTLGEGEQVTGRDFGRAAGAPAAAVVGRHVFYNRSAYDGHGAAADTRDDGAIAPDKRALGPGAAATFDNYTSYARGINGVMVDVANLPAGGALSAADFAFAVGNGPDVASWREPAVTPGVTVRRGAGHNGSDRVTLTWPDNSIVRTWLRVAVNPTPNTGLAAPDVFYFGNLPGEVGDSFTGARVGPVDALRVRADLGAVTDVDHPFDFNRDGRVNATDYAFARWNFGKSLHPLDLRPQAAAAEAAAANLFSDARVAARRAAYRPLRVWEERAAPLLS